jgi:ribosome-binding ATPase YchF (GTP1/OBG family)
MHAYIYIHMFYCYFEGFIRAETMSYGDLIKAGNEKAVKDAGLLRSEGKEYVMQEGDVVLFRFNV